jgi:opacity protein-like surface antigen
MLKKFAAAALLAAGLSSTAAAVDLGGTYEVQGTNPNGTKYGGTAEIVVTSENTCRITWNTGNESSGICMRNGIAFAAAYALGDKVGLIIYEIRDDGPLDGAWTIADQAGVGTELLIPK